MYLVLMTLSVLSFSSPTTKLNCDTTPNNINFELERDIIPGETMGQKLESLLFWNAEEKRKRFPYMHEIFPSLEVKSGGDLKLLKKDDITLLFGLDNHLVSDYMAQNNVGGLLVIQNDTILLEHYAMGIDTSTLWTSFSVAKSITSILLGAALKDGSIQHLDDNLEQYIAALKGMDYGKVTVRQLLTMTSGISWNEDYSDPKSDVAQMYQADCAGKEAHILSYMKSLKFAYPAGTHFNYNTGETDLLGILIQQATGKSLAEYLAQKIWIPFGMQQNAYWLTDECSSLNLGGSGISASLRDFGRLGMFMLQNGHINGQPALADEWVTDATSILIKINEGKSGYGYLWWIDENGHYLATGIFGQMIYINPKKNLIIAQIASWPEASSVHLLKERNRFIQKIEDLVD